MVPTIIFLGLGLLASAASLLRHARPAGRAAALHAYARKVDLPVDPVSAARVAGRLARRERSAAVGGAVAALVTFTALWVGGRLSTGQWPVERSDMTTGVRYTLLLVVLGYFLGHAVGYGVSAWWETTRPTPDGVPRIARATTPTHDDYVARHERWGAWVIAGVSAAVALLLVVLDRAGTVELGVLPMPLVGAAVVVPAVLVGLDEVFARRLLRRRQVASTALDLAWDDALRARALRDMITVVLVVAAYAPLGLLGVVGDQLEGGWPGNPAVGVVSGLFAALVGALVLVTIVSLGLNPQRHVRRRLWPDGVPVEQQPGGAGTTDADADAGTADAGTADAGTADAGTADAGTADAGADAAARAQADR